MGTRDEFYQEDHEEDPTSLDVPYDGAEQADYGYDENESTYYDSDFDDETTQLDTAFGDETTQMDYEYDPLFDDATTQLDAYDAGARYEQAAYVETDPTEVFQAQAQAGQSRFSRAGLHGDANTVQLGRQERRTGRDYASGGEAFEPDDFDASRGRKKLGPGKIALIVVAAIIVLMGVLVGIEFGLSNGHVHRGVTVAGVDVGGLTVEEATAKIDSELGTRLAQATITVEPTDVAAARWLAATDLTQASDAFTDTERAVLVDLKEKQAAGQDVTSQLASVKTVRWTVTQEAVGATVGAAALANQAYEVGRSQNAGEVISQRLNAWFGGVALDATVSFDDVLIEPLTQEISTVVGIPMVNYNIQIAEGVVSVVAGHEGECVNQALFRERLSTAFLDTSVTEMEAPMEVDPIDIDDTEATAVATTVTEAIAQPVTLTYNGQSWEAGTVDMGDWICTRVDGADNTAVLVPYVDSTAGIPGMQAIMGSVSYGSAIDATFDVSSGTPVVVPSQEGSGPDMKTGIASLNAILFGTADTTGTGAADIAAPSPEAIAAREVVFPEGLTQPKVTTADAQAMGVVGLIGEYTLNYGSSSGSNREFNIERALGLLNGSLIAPGENWEWNTIVGNCTYSTGFKDAGVIENGQATSGVGGGICNVATGVFNAAYECALPIVERHNHSLLMSNYAEGRDAAVSWPNPTLIFQNNYKSYIFVTASWDGYDMTISIWGTSEGRTVTSQNSGWSYGSSGQSITNTRTVYDANGAVLWVDEFFSYYKFDPA